MAAMNNQWSSNKTRSSRPTRKMSRLEEYGPMEEKEEARLKQCEKLERRLKRLRQDIKDAQRYKQRVAPYGHRFFK